MADFAPNYTARYRFRYSALGFEHSMLWRVERGTGTTGLALIVAKVGNFLTALNAVMFTDFIPVSAEYAPEDVDIFVPATIPSFTAGVAVIPPQPKSQSTSAISFVGRSSQGQKARMFLWGMQLSPEAPSPLQADDFRVTAAESAAVSAAIGVLNSGSPTIVGSDNQPVSWYSYVNQKYNDHWVKRVRG